MDHKNAEWAAGLTSYQKATVEHLLAVYQRHNICLVADEVGLGKTYVAKGLIRAIGAKRIIYIASNPQIAQQNVKDLAKDGGNVVSGADRLSLFEPSMLPAGGGPVIYPLSPATTFTGRGSVFGTKQERAYYYQREQDPRLNYLLTASSREIEKQFQDQFRSLRKKYNDAAIRAFAPDLIILDEFHRFHDLLDPDGTADYSMYEMLAQLNAGQARPVRLLLLSATPYHMKREGFDTRELAREVQHFEPDPDSQEAANVETDPFENFGQLKGYMEALDRAGVPQRVPYPQGEADYAALYRHMMCRTERTWLLAGVQPAGVQELLSLEDQSITPVLTGHLRYRLDYQRALASDRNGSTTLANQPDIARMAEAIGADAALTSYGRIRAFLDETPEFLQFCDGYKSIQGNRGAEEARRTFSQRLESSGYRIRNVPATQEPCPASFRAVREHYKFSLLLENAMPQNCELLLWVPPTLSRQDQPRRWEALGLASFSKTLVFAHYRMSTRSIAALTSMEAQLRLLEHIQDRPQPGREGVVLSDGVLEELLRPVRQWFGGETPAQWEALGRAVCTFFNTTHAKRVLAAYAARFPDAAPANDWGEVVRAYCRDMGWADMLWEYLDCLNGLAPRASGTNPAELLDPLIQALDWTDHDRTRVLVLPDWREQGYPCTFGERYTNDYSDKKAHDLDGVPGGKRNTARRLGYIMGRFQSPFYPFVLGASESVREGVNLHHYCQTLIHWSVPSNLNALIQEEGRVDRRGSLTVRRQMAWLYQQALASGNLPEIGPVTMAGLFQTDTALAVCRACGKDCQEAAALGLFPAWFLPRPDSAPGFPRLKRLLAALPMSQEQENFQTLLRMQEAYSGFGVAAEQDRKQLCPLLERRSG